MNEQILLLLFYISEQKLFAENEVLNNQTGFNADELRANYVRVHWLVMQLQLLYMVMYDPRRIHTLITLNKTLN